MKQEEIVQLTMEDLKDRLVESKENMQKLLLTHAIAPLENPMQIRSLRKTIARLSTELNKREVQA
ncbi:MAG: 50S ribosomal protein L29 [Crocinitomicaceae bacterium]|nr:50S ribosomal protein L29 [Crocinitomicaceae bacterium]